MARVTTVEKALKDQGTCGKCTKPIKKGDSYRWWKHRYGGGGKHVRCMSTDCRPRQSDLTTSDKLSRVYSVAENVEDAIAAFRDSHEVEDLKSACTDGAEELRAVAEDYRESAQNIEDGFNGNRVPMCDELEEKAEHLDGVADELESAGDNLPEFDEDEFKNPDDLDDDAVVAEIGEECPEGTFDEHLLAHARSEREDFDSLEGKERKEALQAFRDELIDAKRQEMKDKREEAFEEWVDEVAGEVEGVSIEPA